MKRQDTMGRHARLRDKDKMMERYGKHCFKHMGENPINISAWRWEMMASVHPTAAEPTVGRGTPLRAVQCLSHHRMELNRDHERLTAI